MCFMMWYWCCTDSVCLHVGATSCRSETSRIMLHSPTHLGKPGFRYPRRLLQLSASIGLSDYKKF